MHGGAPGSGAPPGNKNALKHGQYTREALAELKLLRNVFRQSRELLQRMKEVMLHDLVLQQPQRPARASLR